MAKVFENPTYLRAVITDMTEGSDTAKLHDRWAYVGADGQTYTHPSETGARKLAGQFFTLRADYDTSKCEIYSADEAALRMFGKHHHSSAKMKADMTLTDHAGKPLATMDEWSTDWTETGA